MEATCLVLRSSGQAHIGAGRFRPSTAGGLECGLDLHDPLGCLCHLEGHGGRETTEVVVKGVIFWSIKENPAFVRENGTSFHFHVCFKECI